MIETFPDKDQALVRYILNELSEDEIAKLEEEMMHDDALYERVQIVEMNLIDSYVRNEMPPEDNLRFKEKFLWVNENRDKVERARAFHESLRRLHGKERTVPPLPYKGWHPPVAEMFQRPFTALIFIASAVLFITVLVVVIEKLRSADNANTANQNSVPTDSANSNPVITATPDNLRAVSTPTPPLKSPVAPVNKKPNSTGIEIARNNPLQDTQEEYINRQGGSGVERSSRIVHITLGKKVTHLKLIYELLDDVPQKEAFGVTIKNEYDEPIWPQNDKNKEEVKPAFKARLKRGRFIIVNVPTSIFKDSGPYLFEFDDPYIPAKNFTINK